MFYLPSYASELNPDERLNADMKHAIGTKVPVRTKAKLKTAAEDHMDLPRKSGEFFMKDEQLHVEAETFYQRV